MDRQVRALRVLKEMPRAVLVLATARFLFALAGELWLQFMPRYLAALGAGAIAVGLWGTLLSGFKTAWEYPGGWLADRWGARKTMVFLTVVTLAGLLLFLVPVWWVVLLGAVLWTANAGYDISVTHKVVGDELGREKRATGFGIVSMLKKPTRVLGPPIGGVLITVLFGLVAGMRVAFIVGAVLVSGALALQWFYYPQAKEETEERAKRENDDGREEKEAPEGKDEDGGSGFRDMPPTMRRLLVADTLARVSDRLVYPFAVLFVVQVLGRSDFTFGLLVGFAALIALTLYLPASLASDRAGRRKPWIAGTFAFFTLYPLTLLAAGTVPGVGALALLVAAFAFKGLQEIGETPRKAFVTELSETTARGRAAGAYYTIRSAVSIPAGVVGGFLYAVAPRLLFAIAAAVAGLGFVFFAWRARPWEEESSEGAAEAPGAG